jgi:hypothetical protein
MVNSVNWFEIPVVDMKRAIDFYKSIFTCDFQEMEVGPKLVAMFSGADPADPGATGALVKGEDYVPSETGSIVYFPCEDVDNELGKTEKAGGQVLLPKTSIGEFGFIAHFLDCEGNRVGLHSVK